MTIQDEAEKYSSKLVNIEKALQAGPESTAYYAYLAAFDGPTVQALVEALKNIITRTPSDGTVTFPIAVQIARSALQKFQEARKT